MTVNANQDLNRQAYRAYELWSDAIERGCDPYETMTPLVARYLLTSTARSIRICYGDLREHPVFALLAIEDPTLAEL